MAVYGYVCVHVCEYIVNFDRDHTMSILFDLA